MKVRAGSVNIESFWMHCVKALMLACLFLENNLRYCDDKGFHFVNIVDFIVVFRFQKLEGC